MSVPCHCTVACFGWQNVHKYFAAHVPPSLSFPPMEVLSLYLACLRSYNFLRHDFIFIKSYMLFSSWVIGHFSTIAQRCLVHTTLAVIFVHINLLLSCGGTFIQPPLGPVKVSLFWGILIAVSWVYSSLIYRGDATKHTCPVAIV